MRQSLIVGARPAFTRGKPFPRVPLGPGNWRIEVENRVQSRISLTIYKRVQAGDGNGEFTVPNVAEIPLEDNRLFLQGPCVISAEIIESGRESYVSVFAYPMNGKVD
jgi:hypothetical protein